MKETHDAHGVLGTTVEIERYLRVYLKTPPRWMPKRIYKWLLSYIVVYESLPFLTLRSTEESREEALGLLAQRGRDLKRQMGTKEN